jgi:putative proteasome-type protease
MTYCLAIRLNAGVVFASDSRTHAGVDHVDTYSKMHVFTPVEDRLFILVSAGNLATTQAVVHRLQDDLHRGATSLASVDSLFEAAQYIGDLSLAVQNRNADELRSRKVNMEASFILGGQIGGQDHDIYLVYPEGNSIGASPDAPFLQIGETKYGKPILDRVITPSTSLEDAARCALVSIDSTMRSNISVGPPVELAICSRNGFEITHHMTLKLGSPLYSSIQKRWNDGLRRAFSRLPRFGWEQPVEK